MRSDETWVAIMTAAIEFVHKQRDRPDVDPSTMLAAINRKVPVTAADLDVAAIRAKQLGSHLRRAAPPCRGYQPPARSREARRGAFRGGREPGIRTAVPRPWIPVSGPQPAPE